MEPSSVARCAAGRALPRPRPCIAAALAALSAALPCQAPASQPPVASGATAHGEVVLCASFGEALLRPILAPFEAGTGYTVRVVRGGRRSADLGALQAALAQSHADVWWSQETLATAALHRAGMLRPLVPLPAAAQELPAEYRDPDGAWFGFAARTRVLMVNTERVPATARPQSMWDQLDPRFRGRVGIARPGAGTARFHLLALAATLGEAEVQRYLDGLERNGCQVVGSDTQLAERIGSGELDLGMTDTSDYLAVKRRGLPVAAILPDQDRLGTLVIPNTLACLTTGQNPAGGRALVEFLLAGAAEAALAQSERGQLPLRGGVPPPPEQAAFGAFRAMAVDFRAAHALEATFGRRLQERFQPPSAAGPVLDALPATVRLDFDAMPLGEPPHGMTVAQTGAGALGVWRVVADPSSRGGGRVLEQVDATEIGGRFPLCLYDGPAIRDAAIRVRFKTMRGDSDRAAGLVLRAIDPDNYYCCRVNSLEDNFRFYKVVDGRRIELAGRDHVPVFEDVWQTLGFEAKGDHFRMFLNGVCVFEADDGTFPGAGRAGLWLKGDSQTAFDELAIGPPGSASLADFEALAVGAAPEGWRAQSMVPGELARWVVVDSGPGAVGRRSVTPGGEVPGAGGRGGAGGRSGGALLLAPGEPSPDAVIETRFLVPTDSPGMHLAGLVARYRAADDHYYVRINLEECNVRLYRVSPTGRKLLGEVHHTTFDERQWHTARLSVEGHVWQLAIDGALQFTAVDDAAPQAGAHGLWGGFGSGALYDHARVEAFR